MPTYSFHCRKCGHDFDAILTFAEFEKKKVKCPQCGSKSLELQLGAVFAKTAKKS